MKNKVVNEVDVLINQNNELDLQLEELQRKRDLKVDIVDKKFTNKIDVILRKKEFLTMQIKQAKEYANKNLGGK